jgi:hypothetical protein
MEQAASGLGIDRWLGIFGAVFGALGIFAAYYFYRKTVRSKVLSISYSKPVPLLASHPAVQAVFRGVAVDALSMSLFLFWNTGSAPIEPSDFIEPVKLKNPDKVIDVSILDKDVAADAVIDTVNRHIEVKILRPNEAIIFRVLAADEAYQPDLGVVMKATDMSSFLRVNRSRIPIATATTFAVLIIFCIGFYIDYFKVVPQTGFLDIQRLVATVAIAAVLILTIGFAWLINSFLVRTIRGTTPPVVWKYFQLQSAASGTRDTAELLKAKITKFSIQ